MKRKYLLANLALPLLMASLAHAQTTTYYVSTQGSDSNSGTSNAPLRTITYAYSLATPGTTIIVEPGTYTDYQTLWGLHLYNNGTASNPIVLKSQTEYGAIIDGQNASDRNQAIYLDGSYNVIEGFQIINGPNGGIAVYGNGNQILDDDIADNGNPPSTSTMGGQGIYSNEGTSDNVYERNYIADNGRPGSNLDHGLYLCGNNEIVANNVVVRNASRGLQIAGYTSVNNMKVYNNVFAWNGKIGITVWMAMNGVDIRNNIIFNNGQNGVEFYDATGSGVTMDHNVIYGNSLGNYIFTSSTCSYTLGTTISTDPLFVNETQSGFDGHLTAGSPAIGAGINFYSTFTNDIAGLQRQATGTWELGAHVYGSTTNVVTTPPTGTIVPCTLAQVGGKWTITWNSTSGKTYWVGYKNSLGDTSWANLSGTITASGASQTTSYTDTTGNHPSRFYCVWVTN